MNDVPLIRYPIEALVAAGISDIAIVVGYLGDKIIELVGNGSDCWSAGDILLIPVMLAAVSRLKAKPKSRITLPGRYLYVFTSGN